MRRLLKKAFWLCITLAGLYLVLIEVGMAISESHALRGTNILFFIGLVSVGLLLFFFGLSRLRGKKMQAVENR
jgi:succinate dehydrogenase/fumarate reductase cytochrome b subunit